ncbi:glycine-rich cell wall structural protein 2 isoform X1 [Anguilla anguilla]|uniref:glycine-rich cell wall structural protein 2 isoform X1 n=1 Tax=Anguilla anguilla TaxID=7936 RepID=UPI0015AFCD79|nr:glycine-rich cell wall structural protein 2 isoform X1 [Anguilla anguilla]
MLRQGLLRAWLVLWLAQCCLQGGTTLETGLGFGRAQAAGAGLSLGALGTRGIARTAGRYPGAMLGMGAYRGVLGRQMRPGYGALGGYGGYGAGLGLGTGLGMKLPRGYAGGAYGYRGQPFGGYGGFGTYAGAGLGLGGAAGYGAGAAGYPGAGLANGYGAGYGNGYMGGNSYGAGLGLPAVLADGAGLAAKAGKGAVGAGVGPVAGASQLSYGGQPMIPAGLGAMVKADSLGEGAMPYVGQAFQSTALGNQENLGGLAAGLGLDAAANKYGEGAYLGAGVPPAAAKSGKFEMNEFLDNGLNG